MINTNSGCPPSSRRSQPRHEGVRTVKAITLTAFATPPALAELTDPTPAANEVLVRVRATSVNPVDNGIAAGMLTQMGVDYEFPVIIGRDYAGVVEAIGSEVSHFAVGDE